MDTINLGYETAEFVADNKIKYASITLRDPYDNLEHFKLPPNYTEDALDYWWKRLNGVNYDNGYGMQYVTGFVVFEDGSWIEREEYDGSENWVVKSCPQYK